MGAVGVIMGVLAACLVIPFAGVAGIVAKDASDGMVNLPEELEAKDLAQKTRIYDANGNLIASIYDQNRINVPLTQISRKMVKSIVAIEDYRFYQHGALDLKGTLRAFLTNQAQGGAVQGGSSITQQMVKQTLLYQAESDAEQAAATEESYARKIRELRYAIAFEKNHSKDWILERYLNIVYFGDGAFGVQSAARHFFSKNAKDLDFGESALLAGLVKNPVGYDPVDNPERAVARRNVVLDRMAQLSVISEKKADKLKARGLGLKVEKAPNGCQQSQAQFFCDYVVQWLLKDKTLGDTLKERKSMIKNGGLTIQTTLDLEAQKGADKAVADHVFATDQAIGGLAMVEPGTGAVRALAQSRPMGTDKSKGETYLNYVVPKEYGDANGFQPGSTFKLFVLAAAINQGIPLSQYISSPQQISIPQNEFDTCDGPYPMTAPWEPSNSTGAGSFNMYTGTQQSVNTFFAQLERETGLCEPVQLAQDMGLHFNDVDAAMVPSFVLGVDDTSPLEMAEAYATFAARGFHCDSQPVTAVLDSEGAPLIEYAPACEQVMPGATADAVNDVLRGVLEPGGFGSQLAIGKPAAGKTGTNNGNMSVWFVGYTPSMATAAMVAGANSLGHWISLNGQSIGGSYVNSAFGSTVAGPIWGQAMGAIAARLPNEDFQAPSSDEIAGVLTPVPDVAGMSAEHATTLLTDAGFRVSVGEPVDSKLVAETIAYSSPAAGTRLSGGDTIVIHPSTGSAPKSGKGKKNRGNRGNDRDDD